MNLYQVNFRHIAPKDNQNGIYCYLVADSSEEVYEWLKEENKTNDEIDTLYVPFEDYEDEDENYKQIIIDNNGETDSDYESWEDLYYGQTHVDWVLKKENIKPDICKIMQDNGIRIYSALKEESKNDN